MRFLRKFNEKKLSSQESNSFKDIKMNIEGLSVDLTDAGFIINSIYELYDGGICAYYHLNKRIYLDDNLIDSILTIIKYGEVLNYEVSLHIDEKNVNISEFPNYTVYQSLSIIFK